MTGIDFEPFELKRLFKLRIGDLMTRDVVTVPGTATMSEAAHLLVSHGISGGPVVDDQGRCVGVISMTDFAKREDWLQQSEESQGSHFVVKDGAAGTFRISDLPQDRVAKYMSSAVQTVPESATVYQAARCMSGERIHRLFVLDRAERPVGVLTSLDLVTAMLEVSGNREPRE